MFSMEKSGSSKMIIMGVIGAVVLLGAVLYFAGGSKKVGQTATPPASQTAVPPVEVRSIAGRVTAVDAAAKSFTLLQAREKREIKIQLGEATNFVRLVFPFDIANPPADATFTPERQQVTIANLKVGDQVFVRAAEVIQPADKEVVGPTEVQILP